MFIHTISYHIISNICCEYFVFFSLALDLTRSVRIVSVFLRRFYGKTSNLECPLSFFREKVCSSDSPRKLIGKAFDNMTETGLFMSATGLFTSATGLFMSATGLFTSATSLFMSATGLFLHFLRQPETSAAIGPTLCSF